MSAATYPEAPGFKTTSPETSFDAAMDMLSNAATLRKQAERILSTFVDCTADEAAKFLGVSPLAMRPRFAELVKQGKMSQAEFDKWLKETPAVQSLPERLRPKKKPKVRG